MTKLWYTAVLAAAVGVVIGVGSARAYTAKIRPFPQSLAPYSTVHDMTYWGGPVMPYTRAYEVLWGSAGHTSALTTGLNSFLGDLGSAGGAASYDVQLEYGTQGVDHGHGTSNQPVTNTTFYTAGTDAYTITPSTSSTDLTDDELASELRQQIAGGHLPAPQEKFGGPVTNYLVMFPPSYSICIGSDCSDVTFCAYHSTGSDSHGTVFTYTVLPESTPPDMGCGPGYNTNSGLPNLTAMASHELQEAITDPAVGLATDYAPPLAWYNTTDGENGDYCNQALATVTLGTGSWTVQKIWSNAQAACVASANRTPVAAAFSPSTAAAPVSFSAGATSSPNGTISKYAWDFGDGGTTAASSRYVTTASASVTHTYASPGAYTVTMIATDDKNISGLAQHLVTVRNLHVAVSGSGSVTSAPAAISCGGTCSANYVDGAVVTLTATPGSGAAFSGWSGDCAGASAACNVTMSAARNVTATFAGGSPPPPPPPAPPSPPAPPVSQPPPAPACVVPTVVGQTLAAAQTTLTAAHCALGTVARAFSRTVAAGRIISQSAPPGTSLSSGTSVNVLVSRGKPPPKVTLCYHHRTIKVTKAKAKLLRKHGAKLGACRKAKKRR